MNIPNFLHSAQRAIRHSAFPIILLLLINLTAGLLTFRSYGLSWDEPLFYDYADAIKLAYTPQASFASFDFEQVYGPSATDHKYYGPAYLLAARPVQQAVMVVLGADRASAWHLVNFLTFQIGLLFFFLLLRRWFDPWPAAAASAFFAWQPVLWGHAFVNPKDMPFMVFFIIAVTLGFWMVDSFSKEKQKNLPRRAQSNTKEELLRFSFEPRLPPLGGRVLCGSRVFLVLLAGVMLGATVAVRVIGPLAGLVVFVYFLLQKNWRAFPAFLLYGLIAVLVMFVGWPFLWADPINRILEVVHHMSDNPTQLSVLFMGQMYHAATLPRRYFPQMLVMTLTEPTWILFTLGLALAAYKIWWKKEGRFLSILIVAGWFGLMLGYVLFKKPPMYDGFRHFLFSIPPVFAIIGFVFQFLHEKLALPFFTGKSENPSTDFTDSVFKNQRNLRNLWRNPIRNGRAEKLKPRLLFAATTVLLLLPGLLGIFQLHPYEYTYYNTFVGGTGGAYRSYETDYWLTCYKESLEWLRANEPGKTIHIQREFPLAAYYGQGLTLKDLGLETEAEIRPGDLLLFSTRADLDIRSIYRKLSVIQTIGRAGADFCLIKQK
jgi:hypothetical protein